MSKAPVFLYLDLRWNITVWISAWEFFFKSHTVEYVQL